MVSIDNVNISQIDLILIICINGNFYIDCIGEILITFRGK